MRVAIIDLGTNTFNLLISDIHAKEFNIVHKEKIAVKLGKHGINDGLIHEDAFKRGLDAMVYYQKVISKYDPTKIIATATSAMRDAENSTEFIQQVKEQTGVEIDIISGTKEAELIHLGVKNAITENINNYVIMDVGGGSTEFIIVANNQVIWSKSYDLGVSRLLDWLKPKDPMTDEDISTLTSRLHSELQEVFNLIKEHGIKSLVGSSGSFDSVHDMIHAGKSEYTPYNELIFNEINIREMSEVHQSLLISTLEKRLRTPGLVEMRADMMVISSIFMNFVIDQCKIESLYRSEYALKEGLLFSLS